MTKPQSQTEPEFTPRETRKSGITVWWVLLVAVGSSFITIWWLNSYRSTTELARLYFSAVLSSNERQAVRLASASCRNLVSSDAREDIQAYGGAEVRNVSITISNGTGSDGSIEWGRINFEYRRDNQAAWQTGRVGVMTAADWMGPRHLICGG